MSYTNILDAESFGVAYCSESAFGVEENTPTWQWLDCTLPQISVEASESTTIRAKKSRGAQSTRETGYRWYRVSFSAPLHGQISTYAFASGTPTTQNQGILHFLGHLDGATGLAYAADDLTGTANANTMSATSDPGPGVLLAAGDAGAVEAMGWVKSWTAGTATLFESLDIQPGEDVHRYAVRTLYPAATSNNPASFTFRVVGEPTSQDIRIRGCKVSKLTFREEADRKWVDIEFVGYGGKADLSSGGLQIPTRYLELEPALGRGNARVVVGSNVISSLAGTTYQPDGSCDVRDLTLTIDFPHQIVRCPTRPEGVAEVGILAPLASCSFWTPKVSNYEVGGVNIFEAAWLNKTQISVTSYFGDRAGRIFCWRIPAGVITAHPTPAVQDRTWGWTVSLEAGHYDGDSGSSGAGNKPFTLAIG